jgi:hypothetical protein
MPLLQIQTSAELRGGGGPAGLMKNLSARLAHELAKPESYVMVSFERTELLFGGKSEPACFAALKNVGSFTAAQTSKLSALLCQELSVALGVDVNRIYIEFVDAKPHLWGFDGATFA